MADPRAEELEQKWRPGAEAGDPTAMAWLGWALSEQGQREEAERWYRRAAEMGNTYGMTRLGRLLEGRGAKDEAQSWWRTAATAGDADAMADLGRSLRKKNPVEAEWWPQPDCPRQWMPWPRASGSTSAR